MAKVPEGVLAAARDFTERLKEVAPGAAFIFLTATADHGGKEGWVAAGGTVPDEAIVPALREAADMFERSQKN